MMAYIKYILDDTRPPNKNPLGVLTTLNRDKWATIRTQLCNAGMFSFLLFSWEKCRLT